MNQPISHDNSTFKQVVGQLALIAVVSTFLFVVTSCKHDRTCYVVTEHNDKKEVKRVYVAKYFPQRHGDYLVFEDSGTGLLARVRYSKAVVSSR